MCFWTILDQGHECHEFKNYKKKNLFIQKVFKNYKISNLHFKKVGNTKLTLNFKKTTKLPLQLNIVYSTVYNQCASFYSK